MSPDKSTPTWIDLTILSLKVLFFIPEYISTYGSQIKDLLNLNQTIGRMPNNAKQWRKWVILHINIHEDMVGKAYHLKCSWEVVTVQDIGTDDGTSPVD